jgi:hypothetical protein
MRLKHVLLASVLSAVAAIMLLSIVSPHSAEAARPTYTCVCCPSSTSTCTLPETTVHTKHQAKGLCAVAAVSCTADRDGAEVCRSPYCN